MICTLTWAMSIMGFSFSSTTIRLEVWLDISSYMQSAITMNCESILISTATKTGMNMWTPTQPTRRSSPTQQLNSLLPPILKISAEKPTGSEQRKRLSSSIFWLTIASKLTNAGWGWISCTTSSGRKTDAINSKIIRWTTKSLDWLRSNASMWDSWAATTGNGSFCSLRQDSSGLIVCGFRRR